MCRRITCDVCGKPSFAGCGRHIESVLGDVSVENRCQCRARPALDGGVEKRKAGLLSRLFGRPPGDAGER